MAFAEGGVCIAYRFFATRLWPDLGIGRGGGSRQQGYLNLTQTIGALVSSRICTLHELQTVYGLEDAFNLLEIVNTDAFNKARQAV
ncbi:unnamed protein product [Neisseria lactamica Y92-1009]|nr:unnamed protein product [Neisseria lactamica Y92-1009]